MEPLISSRGGIEVAHEYSPHDLVKKRDEIRATIRMHEKKIAQAVSDLAHVTAVMQLFEASGRAGLSQTKELALELIKAKGLDQRDGSSLKIIGHRLIHSLRMQEKRKGVARDGKRHGVSVWRLPQHA
jgi:hypothetical protein